MEADGSAAAADRLRFVAAAAVALVGADRLDSVIEAQYGEDALRLLADRDVPPDVVLTDVATRDYLSLPPRAA